MRETWLATIETHNISLVSDSFVQIFNLESCQHATVCASEAVDGWVHHCGFIVRDIFIIKEVTWERP